MAHYEMDTPTKDMPVSDRSEFTLYVNNLPSELNEHGLLQLFNHYGYVKGHFYRSNVSWAYITYGTYLEAENAIKDLHNLPPLHLQVTFAKEKNSFQVEHIKAPAHKLPIEQYKNCGTINVAVANKQLLETNGRGRPLNIFRKVQPNPGLPNYTYTSDNDLLYPYPSDPYTYNPYENAEPYASTNTLWTRGHLTITQDGKRHVSLGRGYTMYEIPEPDPKVHNHINAVYERRTAGLYEYGKDPLQNTIGTCKTCSRKTKLTCENCCTFYCSRPCQIANWLEHKFECKSLPGLVTADLPMSDSQANHEKHTPTRSMPRVQAPLRRPKRCTVADNAIPNEQDINNISSPPCNVNASNISKCTRPEAVNRRTDQREDVMEKVDTVVTTELNNSLQKASLEKDSRSNDDRDSVKLNKNRQDKTIRCLKLSETDVQKMENDISFAKCTFLSRTKFTKVRVIVKMGRELWVQKLEDEKKLAEFMINLQGEAEKAPKIEPVIRNVYAVRYDGVWHRALVIKLDPLTVHYIDYGNDERIAANDFRKIDKLLSVPRFSEKIRLSERAYEKHKELTYEDVISVKMMSIDSDKTINVEVEDWNDGVNQKNNQPTTNLSSTEDKTVKKSSSDVSSVRGKVLDPVCTLKSIISAVTVGEIGILEVHAELKNNTYSITFLPHNAVSDYEKLLNDLPAECALTAEHSDHKPSPGDLVCGRRLDGDWLRGYITSLESLLKMAIVDEARIMPINRTVPCPEKFLDICAFGAVCEITDARDKFNSCEHHTFKVLGERNNGEIEIEISNDKNTLKATVKPWSPMPEQKGVQYAELKNGSEVSLTAYRSHLLLFARPLDSLESEHYNRVMQNVAKCAQTSSFLEEPPVVGQMVIARYVDDNYYRAIVTRVENKKITISYVDFGNTEVTTIKKLKSLTDDLKQLRSSTTKVLLKDVPKDVPMTKEVNDYLSHLVGAKVPLVCTFDGVPSKDGVYLKLHNGENVNKKITELLAPTTKETAERDKTCYMVDDLDTVDLGNIGDTLKVVVLYSFDDVYKYAVCPLDYDSMTHVFDTMPKKMLAYCESSNHYIPRKDELCLALYEGGWYRAACVCRSYTPTTSVVFFIDFGNTEFVNHKDIRLMPKEFMSPNALANICNIVNIAPKDSNGQFPAKIGKRISELLVLDECVTIKIVGRDVESGIYDVELPLVKAKLIEEGLLST